MCWQVALSEILRRVRGLGDRYTVILALTAGLGLSATPASALTGADVAYLVNQRYQKASEKCAVDKPAWFCSGVLMRALPGGSAQTFWQLDAVETALQSVQFAYVRRDLSTNALSSSAGYILADALSAVGQGKPYDVRCAYPFEVQLGATTGSHGCDLAGGATQNPPDLSSCSAQGVTDAASWVAHFAGESNDVQRQCSLSAQVAAQFRASLEAHEQVSPTFSDQPTTVLVAAWDSSQPATIPIEALFYDVGNGGQLSQAQRYQKQYFDATGQWVPILRMAFVPASGATFGFDETDQLDSGFTVADRLNARFQDTAPCPGDAAAYMCDGVIIRVTGYGTGFHSWNPSPTAIARNGVSFSYMRADANFTAVAYEGGAGLIMRELGAPTQTPIIARCIYPTDAATDARADKCGISTNPLSSPCAEQGVTTVNEWRAIYNQAGWHQSCSLGVDAAAFNLSIAARGTLPTPQTFNMEMWNELIIAPWPQDVPLQIPIEAVFYTKSSLVGAQYIQQDYMQTTGRFLPIVGVNEMAPTGKPFTYRPDDQQTPRVGDVLAPSGFGVAGRSY
ncbi:hypothetical protein WK62_22075 [Burkholderia ubonensis]|uniref:hypothetical protein n=1 Tax=Burkholderia ubonensis TaxID=101571 RepID=UPI00075DCBA1|nr:hypothetical protein [Burkholderia ubonensis]KVU19921.1 hypothetical protein WK62_22075 [Burkholderia ubonensis]